MAMESTPDSGVDIKKAVAAPLLAPCFRSDTAAGSTPQDHKGMGMPSSAALKTDLNLPRPSCWATELGLRKTRSKPLTRRPKRTYTEDSISRFHASVRTFAIRLIIVDLLSITRARAQALRLAGLPRGRRPRNNKAPDHPGVF